jgi:hypothetical protein
MVSQTTEDDFPSGMYYILVVYSRLKSFCTALLLTSTTSIGYSLYLLPLIVLNQIPEMILESRPRSLNYELYCALLV